MQSKIMLTKISNGEFKHFSGSIEELAKEIEKRGNRLEIMNGKVYEVSRKLIGQINN